MSNKKDYMEKWRKDNTERRKEYIKKWREDNFEHVKKYQEKWDENHPGWRREYDKQRRPKKGYNPWNKGKHLPEEHKEKISIANRGNKNHNWKGGRSKNSDGYITICLPYMLHLHVTYTILVLLSTYVFLASTRPGIMWKSS